MLHRPWNGYSKCTYQCASKLNFVTKTLLSWRAIASEVLFCILLLQFLCFAKKICLFHVRYTCAWAYAQPPLSWGFYRVRASMMEVFRYFFMFTLPSKWHLHTDWYHIHVKSLHFVKSLFISSQRKSSHSTQVIAPLWLRTGTINLFTFEGFVGIDWMNWTFNWTENVSVDVVIDNLNVHCWKSELHVHCKYYPDRFTHIILIT